MRNGCRHDNFPLIRIYSAVLVLASFVPLDVTAQSPSGSEMMDRASDMYCGSRCIHYFIRRADPKASLMEVVHKVQWPHPREGVTLYSVAGCLEDYGYNVYAMRLERNKSVFSLECDMILHLNSVDNNSGHYVILLGNREGVVIWDGLKGESNYSPSKLCKEMSGNILIVSREPIDLEALERSIAQPHGSLMLYSIAAACVTALMFSLLVFKKAKS